MFGLGLPEMMIVGVIAVLLFGKRLPEVARSLGKGVVEFKKGVRGIEDGFDDAENAALSTRSHDEHDDHQEATAPKFEPPKSEPQEEETAEKSTSE